MTNYIIMGLFLLILLIGACYKVLTKDNTEIEDPFDGPIQRQSKSLHESDNFDMDLANEAHKE